MAWSETLGQVMQTRPVLAYGASYLGGVIATASPCILASIPLVIGFVGGYAGGNKKQAFLYSLTFVCKFYLNVRLAVFRYTACRDCYPASLIHGIGGVYKHIQKYLLELGRVADDDELGVFQVNIKFNMMEFFLVLDHEYRTVEYLVYAYLSLFRRRSAGERQEVLDNF